MRDRVTVPTALYSIALTFYFHETYADGRIDRRPSRLQLYNYCAACSANLGQWEAAANPGSPPRAARRPPVSSQRRVPPRDPHRHAVARAQRIRHRFRHTTLEPAPCSDNERAKWGPQCASWPTSILQIDLHTWRNAGALIRRSSWPPTKVRHSATRLVDDFNGCLPPVHFLVALTTTKPDDEETT